MFPTLGLFSRTTYRGASGSGPGRSGLTSAKSSADSRKKAPDPNWFKRSQRGLFDGSQLQSGNTISHSRNKMRRYFHPNVQSKSIWSDVLGQFIHTKVTVKALRSITKKGGLDAYLAESADWKLGAKGLQLRQQVVEAFNKTKQLQRGTNPRGPGAL